MARSRAHTPLRPRHHRNWHAWDRWAERLAPAYRLIALDLRGRGDSDKPPTCALEVHLDPLCYPWDLDAVCDALGLETVHYLGHSLGAIVGVEKKKEKVGEREVAEGEYLNLFTADGLRSLPLNQVEQTVRLMDSGTDLIGSYLQARQVSPRVKEALQKVIALRDRLDKTAAQRGRLEQRIKEITQEQARLRENMAKLAQDSELYARYVRKLDQQETEIENLRKEIETQKATEDRQMRELNDYLPALDLD